MRWDAPSNTKGSGGGPAAGTVSGVGLVAGAVSGDDGGPVMAMNKSAVDLEINHVRRQLLGRAFNARQTTTEVVHEHMVYREGMRRALDGQRAAWQLHLLENRDVAKARGVSCSHWRPGTAGPVHKPQANVRPYAGPEGDDPKLALQGKPQRYKPKSREQIEAIVKTADRLQQRK